MDGPKPPGTPPVKEWWIALTYMSGAAFIAAIFGVEDSGIRFYLALLALGALLAGLGEWMASYAVLTTMPLPGGREAVRVDYQRRPSVGCLLAIVGFVLVCIAGYQLYELAPREATEAEHAEQDDDDGDAPPEHRVEEAQDSEDDAGLTPPPL